MDTSVRVKSGAMLPTRFPVSAGGAGIGVGVFVGGGGEVGTPEVGVFVGINEGGVTVGVGVSVGATVVGVVPTSVVQAMLNSKRGAARATHRFLIAEENMDSIISVNT